jgi:hypothetical protein
MKGVASSISFLRFVLSRTAFTFSFATRFFLSSYNLGSQPFFISSYAALWILEHIAIDLVTSLSSLCFIYWQYSNAYKSVFLPYFGSLYNSGGASGFSSIHLSMSSIPSRSVVICHLHLYLVFLVVDYGKCILEEVLLKENLPADR